MPPKKSRTRQVKPDPRNQQKQKPLTASDLEGLEEQILKLFGWIMPLWPFQLEGIKTALLGKDVLIHAGTGSGKTVVAAGGHAHPSAKGKVTLMVSPLIALHDKQVETFKNEFNLSATAVNSAHGGCNPEKLKEIVDGKWQIVLISPEMLLSHRFIRHVLQNQAFGRCILNVVVDEAHVVSHWGKAFQKKYRQLGMIHAFLPKGIPIIAMSATFPACIRSDVLSKLQFKKGDYVHIDVGNDCPNVSLMQVPKAFLYADNIATGTEIEDHWVEKQLPAHLAGIVRPYNAAHSSEYQKEVMGLFKKGLVRILICTDAAGMGCNIPDINLVVQWKLPALLSIWLQRAGRAARASNCQGLAVLLVEPSAYNTDISALENALNESVSAKKGKGKKGKGTKVKKSQKEAAAQAQACGAKRGARDGKSDGVFLKEEPVLDPEADDEGLLVFVQTGLCQACRHQFLTKVFQNPVPAPTVPCCDICCPELFDQTQPGPTLKRGVPCNSTQEALHEWRRKIHARDFPKSMFPASAVLSDAMVDLLASLGLSMNIWKTFDGALGSQWKWFEKYGDELHEELGKMEIPTFVALPKKTRGTKRKDASESSAEPSRRQRTIPETEAHPPNASSSSTLPVPTVPQPVPQVYYLQRPVAPAYYPAHYPAAQQPPQGWNPHYNPYLYYYQQQPGPSQPQGNK
ncbi:P-loop containing nucleoside triphosphate hydrolase protein [Mycena floridula]|nr:P-loop containing nucleoside triphosphate hydrolase protein [Mycena floridula]